MKLSGLPVAVALHCEPLCVTLTGVPAMVRVAVRWEELFAVAEMVMVAGPVPLAVPIMVSHDWLELAIQTHPLGNARVRFCVPPLVGNDNDPKAVTAAEHDPAA